MRNARHLSFCVTFALLSGLSLPLYSASPAKTVEIQSAKGASIKPGDSSQPTSGEDARFVAGKEFVFARGLVLANSQKPHEKIIAAYALSRERIGVDEAFVLRLQRDLVDAGVNPLNAVLLPELLDHKLSDKLIAKTASRLVDEAIKDARTEPVALWLAYTICKYPPRQTISKLRCDLESIQAQLQVRDGENLAVWLDDLEVAVTAKNDLQIDQVLQEILKAKFYRAYFLPRGYLFMQAFDSGELPKFEIESADILSGEIGFRMMMALGAQLSIFDSSLSIIANVCDSRTALSPDRTQLCIRSLKLIANQSDSLFGHLLGSALLARFYRGGNEVEQIAQSKRKVRWLQNQSKGYFDPMDESTLVKLRVLYRDNDSEIGMMESILAERGISSAPPDSFPLIPRDWGDVQ